MKKIIRSISVVLAVMIALTVPVNAATMKLNKKKATIYVGQAVTLKVKGKKKKVKWKSTNKKVAKVNKKGKVTGLKAGKSTIIAKVGKKSLKCRVIVKNKPNKRTVKKVVRNNEINMTKAQKNAIGKLKEYLTYFHYSQDQTIKEMSNDGFSSEDIQFALNQCHPNWNEQAYLYAKEWIEDYHQSLSETKQLLEYIHFSDSQIQYALSQLNNVDWNEQAYKAAKSYLESGYFSKSELIHQLEFDGFTYNQAVYGAERAYK